jgi:hypothetical protein
MSEDDLSPLHGCKSRIDTASTALVVADLLSHCSPEDEPPPAPGAEEGVAESSQAPRGAASSAAIFSGVSEEEQRSRASATQCACHRNGGGPLRRAARSRAAACVDPDPRPAFALRAATAARRQRVGRGDG